MTRYAFQTTVVETATKQMLFDDVFQRGPISYCGLISRPNIEILHNTTSGKALAEHYQ